jgi:hypothetical protein
VRKARHGIVVRSAGRACTLERDAVVAVDGGGLLGRLRERDAEALRGGTHAKRRRTAQAPALDVDVQRAIRGVRHAECLACKAFVVEKASAALVGQREVRWKHLVAAPARLSRSRLRIARTQPVPKEREFITEAASVCRLQVAGEIPPFDGEPEMRGVIARKRKAPRLARILKAAGSRHRYRRRGCTEGEDGDQHGRRKPRHSVRTASAVRMRAATPAG